MSRVQLLGGAYSARSIIANAQRCVNLYPEKNPVENEAPVPVTHYLTPGLSTAVTPVAGPVRGMYRTSIGSLFVVIGGGVYYINSVFAATLIGLIGTTTGPVSMSDNGTIVVLVDGNVAEGYWWEAAAGGSFTTIVDPSFLGATVVTFLDGFFIFALAFTSFFYLSPLYWNGVDPFDPTQIASKTGGADKIAFLVVMHRELWIVGFLTSEVWYDTGAVDFPFERQPGVFIEHGSVASFSVTAADVVVFFLGQDRQGNCVVFKGENYQAIRISNHALEKELQSYGTVSDAIGFTYQQDGHVFYFLTFPTADKTWVYDLSTDQWHERTWTDGGGTEHRHRAVACAYAYNRILVGDWENGRIYLWSTSVFDDAGSVITRRRGFPHMVKDGTRISYNRFIADMEVGATPNSSLFLRWSDTRGATWSSPVTIPMGASGDYYRSLMVSRLGMARDRVFELFWTFPYKTALNGAWIEAEKAET